MSAFVVPQDPVFAGQQWHLIIPHMQARSERVGQYDPRRAFFAIDACVQLGMTQINDAHSAVLLLEIASLTAGLTFSASRIIDRRPRS